MSSGYASQEPFSNEALRVAARAVRESMLRAVEEEEPEEHSFSESFLEKMRKLVAIDRQRLRKRAVWQRVAGIVLGILIGSGFFLAFNAEARADIVSWVRRTYENSILYEFFQGTKRGEGALPEIEFTWLPGEYEIQEVFNDGRKSTTILSSAEDIMILNSWLIEESDHFEVFTEDYSRSETTVNGRTAEYYQAKNEKTENVLVWTNDENTVMYNLSSVFPKEMMTQIADGIRKK